MGAGRQRKGDAVDPLAGIVLNKKPGDSVKEGEPLALLYTRRVHALDDYRGAVGRAFDVVDDNVSPPSTVLIDRYAESNRHGPP